MTRTPARCRARPAVRRRRAGPVWAWVRWSERAVGDQRHLVGSVVVEVAPGPAAVNDHTGPHPLPAGCRGRVPVLDQALGRAAEVCTNPSRPTAPGLTPVTGNRIPPPRRLDRGPIAGPRYRHRSGRLTARASPRLLDPFGSSWPGAASPGPPAARALPRRSSHSRGHVTTVPAKANPAIREPSITRDDAPCVPGHGGGCFGRRHALTPVFQ